MKILHCCLSFEYIDDWGYQENILPLMHKKLGYDAAVLTADEIHRGGINKEGLKQGGYLSKDGIMITRIPSKIMPNFLKRKLRLLDGVKDALSAYSPDIIFLHDASTLSVFPLVSYLKENKKVHLVVDCHSDYVNSAKTWVSRNILHKIIYKMCYQRVLPYSDMFFGTLPIRCTFLHEVYGIPNEKISFLEMGFDDTNIDFGKRDKIRIRVRERLNIPENEFVVIIGGKIDQRKHVIELMKAVKQSKIDNLSLIVFGEPVDEIKEQFYEIVKDNEKIKNVGWIDSNEVYNYYFASDLAFFPGTHSVLWEQAVSCGLPAVFKRWEGITHVDLGGNCVFIDNNDVFTIQKVLEELALDNEKVEKMKSVALAKGRKAFSYYEIAKRALEPTGVI